MADHHTNSDCLDSEGQTRRSFMASLPFAGAAVGTPALAQADNGDTPILRLFHKHQAIVAGIDYYVANGLARSSGKDEEEELYRLFYQYSDKLEEEIMTLPSTCAADFAAKMIIDTVKGGLVADWETGAIWQEARALTGCSV